MLSAQVPAVPSANDKILKSILGHVYSCRGVDGLEGSTILNIAVRRERLETVKRLVEEFGADVNIP